MAKITEDDVLLSVAALRNPSGAAMFDWLCEKTGPSRWFKIAADWRLSVGQLYIRLSALETAGFLTSEWGIATAERGWRRPRHYMLTDSGHRRVADIKARLAQPKPTRRAWFSYQAQNI